MKKEELTALGIADDVADKVIELAESETKGMIPKSRFNEVIAERDSARAEIKERDKQLDELKKSAGDNEELKTQIKTLQAENKAASEKAIAEMTALKKKTAVQVAIAAEAQDADIVTGLFDLEKIFLDDNGNVASGLKEQKEALMKDKPFLFKQPAQNPYSPKDGKPPTVNPFAKETFNMTEQGKLFRENPAQARELAAAAGVKI